jgi:hypothetical protein
MAVVFIEPYADVDVMELIFDVKRGVWAPFPFGARHFSSRLRLSGIQNPA